MSTKTFFLPEALYEYMLEVSLREPPAMRALREETAALPQAGMQTSPEQVQFMALLAALIGATRCLEVGVFTGYSTLGVALALPEQGHIVACDVSETFTSIARRHWQAAGVAEKIDLRLAPAIATLDALLADGNAQSFDFAYIDADKTNYDHYYERALELLRPNGLIAVDNMLWSGRVADARETDADTASLRALNAKIGRDERVDASLLPIGDGLMLVRKR